MNNFTLTGYIIIKQFISRQTINYLIAEIDKIYHQSNYGIRQIDSKVEAVERLANSQSIKKLLFPDLNNHKLVRAIYFNKTKAANWGVAWHQDKTIAVRQKIETPGFINWTIKEGVIHVQPPLEIMQNIITLRIHLDNTNQDNGALKIIPQSHQLGFLMPKQIEEIKHNKEAILCIVNAGDALIMSPLVLHASSKATVFTNRRILHLKYASIELPNNLNWAN